MWCFSISSYSADQSPMRFIMFKDWLQANNSLAGWRNIYICATLVSGNYVKYRYMWYFFKTFQFMQDLNDSIMFKKSEMYPHFI